MGNDYGGKAYDFSIHRLLGKLDERLAVVQLRIHVLRGLNRSDDERSGCMVDRIEERDPRHLDALRSPAHKYSTVLARNL